MYKIACTLAVAGLLSISALAQQPVYRFTTNQPYKYLMESTTTLLQEAEGMSQTVSVDGTSAFILTQDALLENGDMHITVKIETALLLVESGQGSQSLGDDLAGKEFGFKMKPNGDVYEPDSSIKLLGNQGIRIAMQAMNLFPSMDAAQLTVGNSWQVDDADTTDDGDNTIIKTEITKYSVQGKKTVKNRECLEITFSKESETSGNVTQMGRDLTVTGMETETGTITYDPAEGVLVLVTTTSNGEQHVNDPNSSMKFDMTSSSTGKTEWITE